MQIDGLYAESRLPVLFLGHGSPMNVIRPNPYRTAWEALGRQFGATGRWPRPRLILCVSAHWLTQGWWLTGMAQPRTIHDFGGFPDELFQMRYPAPGAPDLATGLARALRDPATGEPLGVDGTEWGLDHGCWGVLQPMFPQADIPVIQLSMDYDRPPAEHYAVGEQLRALRDLGVLIVASGNIVHNLRVMQRDAPDDAAYEWAIRFDRGIADLVQGGMNEQLPGFLQMDGARQSHPWHEHFLPLLYAAGAAYPGESAQFVAEGFQGASVSMRSVLWS